MEDVLRRVLGVLQREGVAYTIVGATAVNVYCRPRATADVDIVVEGSSLSALLRALEGEFGALECVADAIASFFGHSTPQPPSANRTESAAG